MDITHGSLHFGILGAGGLYKMGPQDHWDLVGERTLGGYEGTLYYTPHDEMANHAGHLVFYFRARDHLYAASLHAHRQSGWDECDLRELERLLRSLRPANKLPLPKGGGGELGSRVVGKPLRVAGLSDAAMGGASSGPSRTRRAKSFGSRRTRRARRCACPATPIRNGAGVS